MKLGKAIVAAVSAAAAVGAAVYAKRRLDESQTALKKQKSAATWKSGENVTRKEIIRNPVNEERQTDVLKSRINTATREYEELSQHNNDEEREITPISFTFTEAEESGNTGVSFERVFDHFNRLEEPGEKAGYTESEQSGQPEEESVPAADEITDYSTQPSDDDMLQAAAIATALLKLEREKEPVQEVLASEAFTSEPVEEAVKVLEDISSVAEPETPDIPDESIFDILSEEAVDEADVFAQAMAESVQTSEPVEEAVKELAEISEQAEEANAEQPEAVEETAEAASTLEEEFTQAMAESVQTSEPVEEAVKELAEISEQAEEANAEQPEAVEEIIEAASTLEEEFAQAMAESVPTSEPVEEAVKELEEISEQAEEANAEQPEATEETNEAASTLEEEFAQAMAESVQTSEPVEEAVKELEEISEQAEEEAVEEQPETVEEIIEAASTLEEEFAQAMAESVQTSEPVEEAVKEFVEISEQAEEANAEQPEATEETAEAASTLEEEFAQAMAESVQTSEPVEEAVKELVEISEQAEETNEEQSEAVEEIIEAASTLEEEFTQAMAESVQTSEPVEEAVKEPEEISEQAEEANAEQPEAVEETTETASALEEEFAQAMAESVPTSESVEEAVKELAEISEQEEEADAIDEAAVIRTGESVEEALKELADIIAEPSEDISEEESTDYTEQPSETLSEEDTRTPEPVMNTAVSETDADELDSNIGDLSEEITETTADDNTEEKPRTLDFFDLPDEAYKAVPAVEEKQDDTAADMEDLFGNLLVDDEPEEKKTFTDPAEVFSMFDTDAGQDDFDKYNDEKIEEENEKKKTTDTKKYIAQDIADNIASFAQLLEPLNAIKENKIRSKSGILFDWEMRIQSLIGDLPIKTYWRNNFRNYEIWTDEKCMEKAGELLSMLELVGIVRDKAKEVVIDRDTLDYYSAQSEHLNNDFHIGETVVVTRPCWKINGKPARKGEIAKKAPFAEFSRKKVSPLETMLRENSCSDGDVNIPVTEENFCTYDRDIPYVKQAIAEGFCKCAVRRMEDGGALAFFYEVVGEGENPHYPACTLRFEVNIDKNAKIVGRFSSEKV